jgi:hypothetical protein
MGESVMKVVGAWAFIGGIIVSIGVGIWASNMAENMGLISAIMVVLGLIVGLLNVTDKEVNSFIIAAIGLATGSVVLQNLGKLLGDMIGPMVTNTFTMFGVFVAGAVFIPAIKAIYKISKD